MYVCTNYDMADTVNICVCCCGVSWSETQTHQYTLLFVKPDMSPLNISVAHLYICICLRVKQWVQDLCDLIHLNYNLRSYTYISCRFVITEIVCKMPISRLHSWLGSALDVVKGCKYVVYIKCQSCIIKPFSSSKPTIRSWFRHVYIVGIVYTEKTI